ncbi:MAG: methyl-accepting chemotaxis protein, partial [Nitrospinae bacterium]|nr:methyl-accepting chemotaxis protein [Nitrospinota bacterium]
MRFLRDFFNNLPLKYKLAGIIAPTLIALLYYSAVSIMEKNGALNEIADFAGMRDLAVNLSEIVHELQKERGMSVGFLASKGNNLRPELEAQRGATDKKIEALGKLMESFGNKNLEEPLKILAQRIDDLKSKREAISALSMDGPDAIEVYSGIHRASFDVIGGMPSLVNDGEFSNRFLGYYILQLYKELMGLERATLNMVFATDRLTPGMERDLADFTQKQNSLQAMYLTVMSKADGEIFYAFLGDQISKNAKAIKTAAFQRAATGGGFGQDPKEWSKAQTEKINLLNDKLIAGHLQKEMTRITEARLAESKAALRNTWIITITAMLMTLAVSLSIARALTKSVNDTLNVVASLAEGDFTREVPVTSRDEVGALGKSVNAMVADLRNMFVEIGQNAKTLAVSSEEMAAISSQLASGSEEMSAQS